MSVARRSDLPGGTVTLMFTDIEGSTQLLRRLGPGYARVQEEHRRLLRETIERFDGREVDTQGDAFFIAFGSAHDAVSAAGEIHRGLAAHPWPAGVEVRVRIGAHTGQPERRAEGYVGIDVVQAARICAVAHGGQTVVSEATRDLVVDAGIETIDLGTYALKDFPVGLRLFQPMGACLGRDFPPLRTLHATNLPAIPTPLVGRARELELVADLLGRPGTRVITLAGTGGAGKSRLALEVARRALREFTDGVYLVRLAQISDPRLVLAEIGRVLGVGDESSRPRLDAIADALRGKRVLLLMDNFEHVATAARDLGLLLRRTPGPTILATSRGRLRIAGEHVVQVGPLPEDDAATLFLGRAAAVDPTFSGSEADHEIVEQICRRVDCLPLAIELAAARAPVIGLEALLDRLDDALGLLTAGLRDAPARHQTLRATLDWSYDLLPPAQRAFHSSLAVFRGGATLGAIEAVCGRLSEDVIRDLAELVDAGLLRREAIAGVDPRFGMLATVHDYALERLESADWAESVRAGHAAFFESLAREAELGLESDSQAAWYARIERELDNIRAALDFAFGSGAVALGLQLVSSLGRFWRAHGHVTEARRWLETGLSLPGDVPAEVRAYAVWTAARQAMAQHDYEAAMPLVESANELFREIGHTREVIFSLCELANIALVRDETEWAAQLAAEADEIARSHGDARSVSAVLQLRASLASARGEHAEAQDLYDETLALRRTLGDRLLVVDSAYNLGEAAFAAGDHERAQEALEECLKLARDLGDALHEAAALCVLGEVALLDGDAERAGTLLRESLAIYAELPDDRSCAECLLALAAVAASSGRFEDAARLWGASEALRRDDALIVTEVLVEALAASALAPALGDRLEELRREGRLHERELLVQSIDVFVASGTTK